MVFSRSFLAAARRFLLSFIVVIILSSSPDSVQAQGPVDGFSYVGGGYCLDASNKFYDSYVKSGVGSNSDCGRACLGINSNELVGFEWDSLDKYCNCDFNDGFVTSTFPDGFTNRYYGAGDGEVTSADGAFGYYCYKVVRKFSRLLNESIQ
ncbi:hypothetical protein ACHAXS_000956 [Conticribra weissflogii]